MKKIAIFGSGCPTCQRLYDRVNSLVEAKKVEGKVEYSTDINELVSRGIMGSPALVVDDKVVFVGSPGSDEKLLSLLQ